MSGVLEYVNTGLTTGVEYFFYVTPILDGVGTEGTPSNISSDIPNSRAIPWDTENATQIITAIRANEAVHCALYDPSAAYTFLVVGPDGLDYVRTTSGTTYTATPQANYDDATNQVTFAGGAHYPTTMDNTGSLISSMAAPFSDGTSFAAAPPDIYRIDSADPGFPGYSMTRPPTGIYRKVESKNGYNELRSVVTLPDATQIGGLNWQSVHQDTAYIYSGGTLGNYAIDAGFLRGTVTQPGWSVIMLTKGGPRGLHTPFTLPDNDDVWVSGNPIIDFLLPDPGGIKDKLALFMVLPGDSGHIVNKHTGAVNQDGIAIVGHVEHWFQRDAANIIVKRVNSIAQTIATADGYIPTGAFVSGGGWGGFDQSTGTDGVEVFKGTSRGNLDTAATLNAGSYPGSPNITYAMDNPFFNERNIYLSTGN